LLPFAVLISIIIFRNSIINTPIKYLTSLKNEADCKRQGGEMRRIGPFYNVDEYYCHIPIGDEGKLCNNSNDCMGVCARKLFDKTRAWKCASWDDIGGCTPFLKNGTQKKVWCDDYESDYIDY
jgi:hypothetical protein